MQTPNTIARRYVLSSQPDRLALRSGRADRAPSAVTSKSWKNWTIAMTQQSLAIPDPASVRTGPGRASVARSHWRLFWFIVAIALLIRLACFTGLIASDDLDYSRYAQLIAQLNYKPELSQFALRYGLIIPVGLVYKLFGVAEWT